jgi:universal stress protein E
MPTIRRILVTIKTFGGKLSPAVLKAAQLARAYGAQLELFHGLTEPLYADNVMLRDQTLGSLEQDLRQNARRRLEAIADRLRVHSIRVTVCVEWDHPGHEAIIRRATAIKADLIIASLHEGRHRLPWLLRLTDWELARLSPIPVLLVKSASLYRHPAILAAIDPGHAHAKPLQLDRAILSVGKRLAAALRGSLHAVYAYPRFPVSVSPDGIAPAVLESLQAEAERSARLLFQRALRPMRIPHSRQHLIPRPPISAIAEAARDSGCAIVVMGAVSRSGYKRLLIGNTAERLLDDLHCDILVVKPAKKPAKFANQVPQQSRGARLGVGVPTSASGYAYAYY